MLAMLFLMRTNGLDLAEAWAWSKLTSESECGVPPHKLSREVLYSQDLRKHFLSFNVS